ncbi:MAG: hypothetical protein R2745_25485 [Vicinamibacterales bacterium]
MSDGDFYIGYEPTAPPAVAARVRMAVLAAVVVVLTVAGVAMGLHAPLRPARFDFGRPRQLGGRLARLPYPSLTTGDGTALLVGRGKHGAEASVAAVRDGEVTVQGTAIERGGQRMFEVVPGSVSGVPAAASWSGSPAAPGDGPVVTLTGEIVDGKCFLGVMNPGEGAVHRDCAGLCLRGGVPPMLLVRDGQGREALVLLVGADGRAVGRDLADLAGLPVTVTGRLSREGDQAVFAAEPSDYRLTTAR